MSPTALAAAFFHAPECIGVWGASAGGHLAAFLGTAGHARTYEAGEHLQISSGVQAVCDWFGPTDILQMDAQAPADSAITHDRADSPESRRIGGPIQELKDQAATVNPIPHTTRSAPPFPIIYGDHDNLVPTGQSQNLHQALRKAGVSSTLIRLPGAGHGGPPFEASVVREAMESFFAKHLKE